MTEAVVGRRAAQPLGPMIDTAGEGWAGLEAMFAPKEGQPVENQPSDEVAIYLARGLGTPRGRAVIEWLMDITFRQPFRATGKTFEETALLAANRQGSEGVGEVILAALKRGQELIDQGKG